jgi:opacity protein-like surface antigen
MRGVVGAVLILLLAHEAAWAEAAVDGGYGREGGMALGISGRWDRSTLGGRGGGGVDFAYFLLDSVAPGAAVEVTGGPGLPTLTMLMATLRLVPLRTGPLSIFIIGEAGRALISGRTDSWVTAGGGGVAFSPTKRVRFEFAYELLSAITLDKGSRLDTVRGGVLFGF